MREQFYISWVEGRISKDEVSEKARQYQIELGGSVRTVVTFRVNPSLTCEERKEEETPENLIPIALKRQWMQFWADFMVYTALSMWIMLWLSQN